MEITSANTGRTLHPLSPVQRQREVSNDDDGRGREQTPADRARTAQARPVDVDDGPAIASDDGKGQATDGQRPLGSAELTPDEQEQVRNLQQRDRAVRAHEQAHLAAAGSYARGGARYTFTMGPDGRAYAVGGEVSIDTSSEDSPEATIRKMQVVRAAALAPADPSASDRAIAGAAQARESQARAQLQQQRQAEMADADKAREASSEQLLETEAVTTPKASDQAYEELPILGDNDVLPVEVKAHSHQHGRHVTAPTNTAGRAYARAVGGTTPGLSIDVIA